MSIYVFDIDGTISTDGKKVNTNIANKIVELSEKNKIIFASARPIRDMLPIIPDELHSTVLIGCNGGMAWEDGKIILSHVLEPDFVLRIIKIMNSLEIPYVLDGEWSYSCSKKSHHFQEYIRSLSNHEVPEREIISNGVTKILILSEIHKEKILTSIESDNVSIHTHSSDNFYDFTPKGNNKYRTLNELIKGKKYIAFGNDQNDFIMLNKAEISVFIGKEENFGGATFYASMDEIPNIINLIKHKEEQNLL